MKPTHLITLPPTVVLFGLVLGGCRASAPAAPDVRDPYAVYGAVLHETVLAEGWGGQPHEEPRNRPIELLVIAARTGPLLQRIEAEQVRADLPSLDPTALDDFVTKADGGGLERRFEGIGPYVLFTDEDRAAIFGEQGGDFGWRAFYERFPGAPGIVAFSPVGFSEDGTQAFVYMSHGRGGTWGHGTYYLLRRDANAWRVVERSRIWEA